MTIQVVLFEPEIPQNAGNIARTCACLGAELHLVEPMGFRLSQKQLSRAAMDYWESISLTRWSSTEAFLEAHGNDDLHFFTGQTDRIISEVSFDSSETYLIFGRESRGIDPDILAAYEKKCVRIPMLPSQRSLNVSNAAAIAVYEVLRGQGFPDPLH